MTSAPASISTRDLARTGRPVEQTVLDLTITGHLPPELDGCYVRIGPNPLRSLADRARPHCFTGEGMVQGVRLRDGRAEWYRSRWIRTDRVCREFGMAPTPGPRHGLSDNANVNVIRHGGRTLALGEAGVLPIELDENFESVCTVDFDGTLPNGFAAHPVCDPVTGELFTVAYYHELPYAQYLVIDAHGRTRRSEPIDVEGTPMMHAVSLTDRHVICFDLPVVFDPVAAGAGSRCPYSWAPGRQARLGVLPREEAGSAVAWFEIEPCYVFHPLNAYEDGDRIIVDVIRHERVFDRERSSPVESTPQLWRWTLDLASGRVTSQQLDDRAEELPRIDERRVTMPYRYAYTVAVPSGPRDFAGGQRLLKHDLRTGAVEAHDYGPGLQTCEAAFVPRSACSPEDEGWLLSYVLDASTQRTELVVLNAEDITGTPQAVVPLPPGAPSGIHANWIGNW